MATRKRVAGGEADLVVRRADTVLVEVKTVTDGDPFLRLDDDKERVLRRIAAAIGATRIDVVGVVASDDLRLLAVHGW